MENFNGIYGGGPFLEKANLQELKSSTFNSVVCWAIHVDSNGDLNLNGTPICTGGKYSGPADWPGFLAEMFEPQTTVTNLLFSIGGWEATDFQNMGKLIVKHGTGPANPLYQNFKVLKETIPQLTTIDFDYEGPLPYDKALILPIATMLYDLGYVVTFCPYEEPAFWISCLKELGEKVVKGFNLQCYAGGAGNASAQALMDYWITPLATAMGWKVDKAASFIRPGLWCKHGDNCTEGQCPEEIQAELASWKSAIPGLTGGWIYLYANILSCESSGSCNSQPMGPRDYAQAVIQGLA